MLSGLMCLQLKKIFRAVPKETPIADLKIMQKKLVKMILTRIFKCDELALALLRI